MSYLYEFLAWNVSLLGSAWYWIIALVGFWLHLRIEQVLNGGGGSRDLLSLLRESFLWAIPGSRQRRGEWIRQQMEDDRCDGEMGGYSYKEIRANNLYEEVGVDMLPGPFYFWSHVIGWIFWPTAGIAIVAVVVLSNALHLILRIFLNEKQTQALYDKIFD